jgi:hypothetical protein
MLLENSTFINNKAVGNRSGSWRFWRRRPPGQCRFDSDKLHLCQQHSQAHGGGLWAEKREISTFPTVHFPATGLVMLVEECLSIEEIPFRLTSLIPLLLIISLGDIREVLVFLKIL